MNQSIEQIKQTNDIVRTIGRYVRLEIRGDRATGLCPFHDDHHPSLQVSTRKQHYICYACGAKGDVIQFVKEIEKCTFADALQKLAPFDPGAPLHPPKGGTPMPTRQICHPPANKRGAEISDQPLPDDNHRSALAKSGTSTTKKDLSSPLGGLRGLLDLLMPVPAGHPELTPTWLEFEIGMAPHLVPGKWKYLAGRMVFPIRDAGGTLVGYTGRLMDTVQAGEKTKPKYINTSAADGYQRNQHLYGFYKALPVILKKKSLCLVEGTKDTLAMHAAGITHTVGLCGKDLSEEQIRLFAGLVHKVWILLDGDTPGKEAASKIHTQLTQKGIKATILTLADGHDPDSLFRQMGKERFYNYLKRLSDPSCHLEHLLVTGCLLHPGATLFMVGQDYPCSLLLSDLLQDNLLTFHHTHCKQISDCMKEGQTKEEFPSALQAIAEEMIRDHEAELQEKTDRIRESGKGDNAAGQVLQNLLMQYTEIRYEQQSCHLLRIIKEEMDETKREHHLRQLQIRRQTLAHVTRQLKKSPIAW